MVGEFLVVIVGVRGECVVVSGITRSAVELEMILNTAV